MKKIAPKLLLFFIQILIVSGLSAQNIAPNYSFENYSSCPTGQSQIDLLDDWYDPANGSPDYFNSCANGGYPDVPFNGVGYQEALTGEGYVGILGSDANFPEYIQAELTEPLDSGQCYYLEMFVCPGLTNNTVCYAVSHLGIYLSPSPPPVEPDGKHIYTNPQLYYNYVVNDTINWTPLSGTYVAQGGEQYITIGNFFPYGSYDVELLDPGCQQPLFAYYYIENVKVEPIYNNELNLEAEICEDECYTYLGNQYCSEGVYEISVNEDCYSTVYLTVSFGGQQATAVIEEPDLLDCDVLSIFLDASGSSGGGVSYQWTGPNNFSSEEQNPEVVDPGVYTLIVSGGGLCSAEASVEVLEEMIPPDISVEAEGIIDCHNLAVTLTGSSNNPNVTYNWNGPGLNVNTQSTSTNQAGTYTFTVTTVAGCTNTQTVIVEADFETPDIAAEVDGIIDCNNPVASLNGSSNTPNVTYNWSGPGLDVNTQSATTEQSGNFTLVVTAPNGCTSSEAVFVLDDLEPPDIFAEVIGVLDCNNSSVTLTGGSATQNVSYFWSGPGVDTDQPITSADQPGIFTFGVIGPNSCISSQEVFVFENVEPPDIFAEALGVLDCNTSSVVLSGGSATLGVTYLWYGPGVDTNQPVTQTEQAGLYTFTVSAPNGCTSSATVEVFEENSALDIEASVDGILNCENETVTLTGSTETQNVTYQWTGPGLLETIPEIEVDQPGEYTFFISDGSGCTADTTILVEQNIETPEIIFDTPDTLNCNILSVDLDASASSGNGDLAFEWQNGNGDLLGVDSVLNVAASGVYTLVLTDSENGCSEQTTIEVLEDAEEPVSTIESEGMLDCQNSSLTLDGSNSSGDPLIFQWTDEDDEVISNDTSVAISIAGIYTLLVLNTANGCTNASSIEIEINVDLPTAIIEPVDSLNCNITETTLDGTGSSEGNNITFEWQNPDGDSIANALQTTVDAPGIYTLIVFDNENGCSTSSTVEVLQDIETPVAVAGNDELITCDESTVTLDGSASTGPGTLTFEWTNSNGAVISNTETAEVNLADICILTVIAENGCSASDELEVTLDTNIPVADAGAGGTLNCELQTITLGGNGTSSGNNITYQWLDQSNNEIAITSTMDVDLPGTYTLIVTDGSNNCSSSASIVIPQDIALPIAAAGNNATLNCLLTEIELDGSQSSSGQNIEYQWLNSMTLVISNEITTQTNLPDTYTLIVTNTENSCTAESTVIIDQNIDTPIADAGNNGMLTCDLNEISLDGSASTGNNLSFEWFNQSVLVGNEAIIQVSEAGIYDLMVTNMESGCTAESSVEVIPDGNLPTAIATADDILTCETTEVTIDGSASTSVSGNIGFEWLDDGGNTISTLENAMTDEPGIYTLIVTDTDNGCSISTTVEIQQDIEAPVADAGNDQTLTCSQTDVTLDGSGSTGQNLSFEWQDASGNPIATTAVTTVMSGGTFVLFVTNGTNGCTASASVEVMPDTNLPTANAGADEILNCDIIEITLDGTASSTGPNIEYEWQNSGGSTIATTQTTMINSPGTYTLIVLDTDNNCQTQDQVVIGQDIETPIPNIDFVANQEIDCNNSSIVLDATGSAPFGTLNFEWTTVDGAILLGEDTPNPEMGQAGTYTLTITNSENGCTQTESIEIVENLETPIVTISTPQILTCDNTETEIYAFCDIGSAIVSWSTSNGNIISGQDSLVATIDQPGDFIISVINIANGCETTAQTTVLQDITPPTAVANADEEFDCITESIVLDGNGSSVGNSFIYQWFGSSLIDSNTSLNPTIYIAGSYTLQVTNIENGCTQMATILIEEDDNVPTAAEVLDNDPLCFGESGSISILSVTGGHEPYLYSIDGGQNFSPANTFSTLEPGDYNILIQDAIGCEYEETINIQTPTLVNVSLLPEVVLQLGQNYQITAVSGIPLSEIDTIIWSPVEGLSCTNCLDPRVESILNEIEYSLTIINENGCKASDQIMLRVEKTREVFIPNAFSPNDDGTNDKFMIFANNEKIKQINTFQVYDRWGEQIYLAENFDPNDPAFGWDGTLNEEKLNPAVFVYFAEIEFIDGVTILYKGDVTLAK